MILGEKSERQDQSCFSFLENINFPKSLPRAPEFEYPPLHPHMGLAPSPNCECDASKKIANYVLTACPIHRAPHAARGLTVLDDEMRW